jgi:thioredoxin-related protein
MHGKFVNRGVEFVVIDASNRKEQTLKIVSEKSPALTVVLDEEGAAWDDYQVYATPTTLIVDPAGKIIFKHVGYGPGMEKMLEKEIDLLLQRQTT